MGGPFELKQAILASVSEPATADVNYPV